MSAFRDDLGAALERVARLEEENERLRTELARLKRARSAFAPAASAPSLESGRSRAWEAGVFGLVLFVGVAGALVNLHLADVPVALDAHTSRPAVPTTSADTATTGLDLLGCTTPFVYEVGGQLRPACLSTP